MIDTRLPLELKQRLSALDTDLLRDLVRKSDRSLLLKKKPKISRSKKMEKAFKNTRTAQGLSALIRTLEKAGSFRLGIENHHNLHIARAAHTKMWPMGTNYWMRDNALIADRLLSIRDCKALHPESCRRQGREMLLSSLTILSKPAQQKRFEALIQGRADRRSAAAWPQIFLTITNNLHAGKSESWSHKQDAFQMLAVCVFQALHHGDLRMSDLSAAQKKTLGYLVPFLIAVDHTTIQSSGSWEELEAVRTSVIGWELVLIEHVRCCAHTKDGAFLQREFDRWKRFLPQAYRSLSLEEGCLKSLHVAAKKMEHALPYECPDYRKTDARFRSADSALIEMLDLDVPLLVARVLGKTQAWVQKTEKALLSTIHTLDDARTGGMLRYQHDSYQGTGFFRYTTVERLNRLYGAPSGDASGVPQFLGRGEIIGKGRSAAWTHFVWQLAAWAGRRAQETGSKEYRRLHDAYFARGLSLFTGEGEVSIEQADTTHLRVIRIPPLRMPECYITDVQEKQEIVFPSPHTPLNWSVAEMLRAFSVRAQVLGRTGAGSTRS